MKKIILIVFTLFSFVSFCYALETDTHQEINKYVAKNILNGFSLDTYLKDKVGIQGGTEEKFNSHEVWWWIQKGGLYEDVPYWYMLYLRSVNHFHNPLTYQGFSGIWGTGFLHGESSIQWSQKPIGTQSPGGHYSWFDVRDYFYKALTASDKTTRDQNFADTFRGLGQLMHLVEDLSVPEHTRDDGHYIFYNYEKWVKANAVISQYPPIYFDSSAIGNPHPLAPIPIANLFDSVQYVGTNPNITLQNNIGLSEYTNANFLSPDTMFTSAFPYPSLETVVEYEGVDAEGKRQTYLKKLGNGEKVGNKIGYGESISHLAASKWFYPYLPSNLKNLGLKLDEKVYSDYAQKLIPRAVGYSAGLLDYFFRGDIDLVEDTATGSGYVIVNNIEENMNGTFEFWYDDKNDNRKLAWSGLLSIGKKSSGNNKSSNITFTQPNDAKECGKYIVVFKGQMGNEQGAVAGRVKDFIKECVTGRLVRADWSLDGNWIFLYVYTESGLISASFNNIHSNRIVAVRFNLSNYDEFIVLTIGIEGYNFHKFTIDEPNKTINYNGINLILPYSILSYSWEDVMPECTYIEEHDEFCGGGTYKSAIDKRSENDDTVSLIDFYYNNGAVKPFGFYAKGVYVSVGEYDFCDGMIMDSWGGWSLESETKRGIYYGEKLVYTITYFCTGGTLPSNCGFYDNGNKCSGTKEGDIVDYYFPIAIFTDSQYAYAHYQYLYPPLTDPPSSPSQLIEIISPAPLAGEFAPFDWRGNVKTMLRKDSGQSVYYKDPNGTWYSYSSELGNVDGMRLIANFNNRNIGWDINGNIVECKKVNNIVSCEILKHIGGSFGEPFDVSIKMR